MHILVTGFEPFGNDSTNASMHAVNRLPKQLAGHQITSAILPVSFERSGKALRALLAKHHPDALICVGEAGGREAMTPECWAANENHARIADNDGAQPQSATIDSNGPLRLPATLDPDTAVQALRDSGFLAQLSEDAGRFVCNHVAYLAYSQPVPALFIHVPALRPEGMTATVGAETDAVAKKPAPGDLSMLPQALGAAILGAIG